VTAATSKKPRTKTDYALRNKLRSLGRQAFLEGKYIADHPYTGEMKKDFEAGYKAAKFES
jgi:hypothetical protein